MLHPIFRIDELTKLVIDELVETSRPAAVSFALTCRSLEELTLSLLWREQLFLTVLVRVLPGHTWVENKHDEGSVIVSGRSFPVDRI